MTGHDITNMQEIFGRLSVIGDAAKVGNRPAFLCRCACGNVVAVQRKKLRSGHTKSCGCLQRQRAKENSAKGHLIGTTHGLSRTHEWNAWMQMRSRVTYGSGKSAERYVGRGIEVHPEWDRSFEAFLQDVGPAPSRRHTIDRIDNDGNYVPGNVRWATRQAQNRNKSDNIIIVLNGKQMTLAEAVEKSPIPYTTAWHRIRRAGWAPERALTQPVRS